MSRLCVLSPDRIPIKMPTGLACIFCDETEIPSFHHLQIHFQREHFVPHNTCPVPDCKEVGSVAYLKTHLLNTENHVDLYHKTAAGLCTSNFTRLSRYALAACRTHAQSPRLRDFLTSHTPLCTPRTLQCYPTVWHLLALQLQRNFPLPTELWDRIITDSFPSHKHCAA